MKPIVAVYRTHDLYFAALLKASGVQMLETERDPRGRVSFIFDAEGIDIDGYRTGWINRTATVGAYDFAQAIRDLKNICHF